MKIKVVGPMLDRRHLGPDLHLETLIVWINAETFLFDRLWLRYTADQTKKLYGYLAANVHDYKELPNGLMMPTQIEWRQNSRRSKTLSCDLLNA